MALWGELEEKLWEVRMNRNNDAITWPLEKDAQFSVRSLYKQFSFGGVCSSRWMEIWGTKVSLTVRIFVWQIFDDKLQITEQLKKREWKGEINCLLCRVKEDMNHIMFKCVNRRFVWLIIKEAFGWPKFPVSAGRFCGKLGQGRGVM
jgi:hypothetical protein